VDSQSSDEGLLGWEGESEMRVFLLQMLDHVISLCSTIYAIPSSTKFGPKELQEYCR